MQLRKRVKKQEEDHEAENEGDEVETGEVGGEGGDADATAAPARKKRGGTAVVRRRRKGKLAQLLEMPIEIFTEVACYMTPGDLLNLARTSIGLRKLLMSKSSIRVWEAARTLQDIPDCPPDLSEPQYADFLFGKGCSFCSEARTRKAHTALRVRTCKTCTEQKLIGEYEMFNEKNYRPPSHIDIEKMTPYTTVRVRVGRHRSYSAARYIKSDLDVLLDKIKDLSSNADDLKAFVEEMEISIKFMRKFNQDIDTWINDVSERKEDLNEELVNARRTSILKKLRELGYGDEDLDPRHDEKGWKWKQILKQRRPLSERVWQNIKPQLEATIKLRREHAAAKFLEGRRSSRKEELRRRFGEFRRQIQGNHFGALIQLYELEGLSVVKEFLEENEYRLPMNEERWLLLVTSTKFSEAVVAHAKVIEADCVKMIERANATNFDTPEKADPHADNIDSQNSQIPEIDEDCIPSSLLAATSLFKRQYYSPDSYAELLQNISNESTWSGIAWSMSACSPSAPYVSMASRLLDYLQLPKETTMAYMLACGSEFRCSMCIRSDGTTSMTWSQLVYHFVREREEFESLTRKKREKNLDTPIRDDHDLDSGRKIVTRVIRPTVYLAPTAETADRYSALSPLWAKRFTYGGTCPIKAYLDDELREATESTKGAPVFYARCKLCEKIGGCTDFTYTRDLCQHMRNRHGTDLEGNPLCSDCMG